jgi:hypothetical protein
LNRQFLKEEVKMSNKYVKRDSTPLAIKRIQMKITLRFQLTPVRMAVIKKTNSNKCCEDLGREKEPLYTVDGNVN